MMQSVSDTSERILFAARKLFAEKGYAGACTKEIARKAGIAEVTLFRHFASKDNLLEEVMARFTCVAIMPEILAEVAGLPCDRALATVAERFIDYLISNKEWVRIMLSEMQRVPDRLFLHYHEFLDDLLAGFVTCFRRLQQRGCLEEFDLEVGARMFCGFCFNYFTNEELLRRKCYKPTDREATIGEFVRIFLRGTGRGQTVCVDGERVSAMDKKRTAPLD